LATALPPNPLTPERLTGISTVIVVAGGYLHTVVLKSAGTVWVWDRTATAKSATTRQEIDWFPKASTICSIGATRSGRGAST
jgi:hypothetical protein